MVKVDWESLLIDERLKGRPFAGSVIWDCVPFAAPSTLLSVANNNTKNKGRDMINLVKFFRHQRGPASPPPLEYR